MTWFKRAKPEPPPVVAELEEAREERKSALQRLMQKIGEIPLEESLMSVGKDLSNVKKDAN